MMRIVFFAMLLILVPAIIASSAVKPENFVGIWLFDEGKGNTTADLTPNKNDGTVSAVTKWTDGIFGKALLFEDMGEVKIQSTDALNLGDKFTMMAYFYATALDDWHQLIAKDAQYLLRIDPPSEGKNMSAFVSINGWEPRSSAGVPDIKTWIHFAATYDSKTTFLTTFVNGEKKAQVARAGKPVANVNPVTIGHWGGGSNFKGIIDEVAILNVALEANDIKDIATNGLKIMFTGGKSVSSAGKLTATWGEVKCR